MAAPRLNNRYEIKEVVGEGGMGIVYRAVDLEMQSDVALKTIRELLDDQQIELFRRECAVLRKVRHPNIVDLYDFGITEEGGEQKPFFVMPFLPGATLDRLIRSQAARLTPDRVVDIITQTSRGLQAAHDLGLVHRDIKPSNIFVLSDDSVKIIDFGVVHVADQHSRTGFKGTLAYMSPEQWEMNPPTAVSDVFSLAVVCYESLTRRRPFTGATESEMREAVLNLIPPPIFELNPAVSVALSQVVHAAMAKQPWNRTSTARQFAEELQKALHGQPIERFDPSRIEPRIVRVQKALEASEYDFASEIITEIEAEGHIDPNIRSLRKQIDQAVRARTVKHALESAQHRFSENEYQLALQKVEEVLRFDPTNAKALALKTEIDSTQKTQQIDNWFRHAQDHLKNYAFNPARQALQNVLRLKPTNTSAIQMIAEVDRRENEYLREHREKEDLYKSALEAWRRGEVSVAFGKLERVLDLDRRAPDIAASQSAGSYQNLYEQVRSEHDRINKANQEIRKLLADNDFLGASSICEQILSRYSDHTLFQALKEDIGERQRQYVSSYIIKIDRDIEAEPDLDRKVAILSDAFKLYPDEVHFRDRLDKVTRRRDLVAGIKQKIDNLEERGQYAEALSQVDILRAIYPQYPGLDFEVDRISKRREQQSKVDAKASWVNQIDAAVSGGDFSHALTLAKSALTDFPEDAELIAQERLARHGQDRAVEATRVLESAQELCTQGDLAKGLDSLWEAFKLDNRNPLIQAVLVETLLKRASAEMDANPAGSAQLVDQALRLDPGNRQAVNLQRLILDQRKDKAVDQILSRSREVQASGDLTSAMTVVQQGLGSYPDERRLLARRESLLKFGPAPKPPETKEDKARAIKELYQLHERMEKAQDAATVNSLKERSIAIVRKYPEDSEVEAAFKSLEDSAPPTVAVLPAAPETRTPDENESAVRRPSSGKTFAIVALISVVVLGGAVAAYLSLRGSKAPVATSVQVTINGSIPGARVFVDSKDVGVAPITMDLADGSHTIDATMRGYASEGAITLRVEGGTASLPLPLTVPLNPLPVLLRVSTEFQQGALDNEKLTLDGAGFDRSGLSNGTHVLQLSNPVAGSITVEFDLEAGKTPVVRKMDSTQTLVVALAALKDAGQLYSSSKSLKVGLNGATAQPITEASMAVNLLPGRNILVLDDSKNPITVGVDVDESPGLTIFVGAQPNVGNLEITETNRIDATASIEPADKKGPAKQQQLNGGKTTFARLEPKTYIVEVSAFGYETAKLSVAVVKGDVTKAPRVTLKAVPTTSTLAVTGGTPEAEVFVDSGANAIGRLNSSGSLSVQIPAGKHKVQLRRADFEEGPTVELDFPAGGTTRLSAQDSVVLRPFGWIEFNITPATSRITYRLANTTNPAIVAKAGDMPHVKAGRYVINLSAPGYLSQEDFWDVEPGKGRAFARTMVVVVPDRVVRPITFGKEALDPPLSQVPFSLFRQPLPGIYAFKLQLRRSGIFGKRAKWVVNYLDNRNYIEYELDDKNLKYTTHQNGKEQSQTVQHGISPPASDVYDLSVAVGPNEILISGGGRRIPLPTPSGSGSLIAGRFGFPKDETVESFLFTGTTAK